MGTGSTELDARNTAGGRRGTGAMIRALRGLLLPFALAGLLAAPTTSADVAKPEPLGHFPTSSVTIDTAGGHLAFKVWVASTEPRRNQGLMFVKSLPPKRGMLFLFPQPNVASFWMKNTFIPLDLLFVAQDGRIIHIAPNATPQSEATISSMGPVIGVLEFAGGTAERLGIKPGDRVHHEAFTGS